MCTVLSGALLFAFVAVPFHVSGTDGAVASPGVPADPIDFFFEDFEYGMGANTVPLTEYSSADGVTYSGDAQWQNVTDCNNLILRYESPVWSPGDCGNVTVVRNNVQRLADVLGQVGSGISGGNSAGSPVNGSTTSTRSNHAVAAYTYVVNMPNNLVVLESTDLDQPLQSGHFYTSSIDVAEVSCEYLNGNNNSRLDFDLIVDGQKYALQEDPIRACTDRGVGYYTSPTLGSGWGSGGDYVAAGRYYSDRSFLMPQSGAGRARIEMTNRIGSSQGNDFAYDNIQLIDATPQLDKSFSPATIKVGETSTLTFTVTNTSDLAEKDGWRFTDTLPQGLQVAPGTQPINSCDASVSAVGGQNTIAITNGMLAEGEVSCTVQVKVVSTQTLEPLDPPVRYQNCASNISNSVGVLAPDCATLELQPAPFSSLSIEKTADAEGITSGDAGKQITYTFTIKNTGNTVITDVKPKEQAFSGTGTLGAVTPSSVTLTPGQEQVFTAIYTVTADDVTPGATDINNEAIAVGRDPENVVVKSDPSNWEIELEHWIELVMEKTSSATQLTENSVGTTITYTFTVRNKGNVPAEEVTPVETEFNGEGDIIVSPASATIAPGDSAVFTASYTVTKNDVLQKELTNTAYATGVEPDGKTDDSPPSTETIPVEPFTKLSIEKTVSPLEIDVAMIGEEITYSFVVKNEGSMPLTNVRPTEVSFNGTGAFGNITPSSASLEPGESATFTATYVVTEADVHLTSLDNVARAIATSPGGQVQSDTDDAVVTVDTFGKLELEKSANQASITPALVGEEITYTFRVTNTGTEDLTNVRPVEDEFNGSGQLGAFSPTSATIPAGEFQEFTAQYTVMEADLLLDSLDNIAYASGDRPSGDEVDSPPSSVKVPVPDFDSLTIEKMSRTEELSYGMIGQTITYRFVVTNNGKTTLTDVAPVDVSFNGAGPLGDFDPESATLSPQETRVFIAPYVVQEEDLRNTSGTLTNTAIAGGESPIGGGRIEAPPSDNAIPLQKFGQLSIEKTANVTQLDEDSEGKVVTYSFVVTNTGTAVMEDVLPVEEPGSFSGTGTLGPITPGAVTLQPGASQTFEASYVVTKDDLKTRTLENTAFATGIDPNFPDDPIDSPEDTAPVKILPPRPAEEPTASPTQPPTQHQPNPSNVPAPSVTPEEPVTKLKLVKTSDAQRIPSAGQVIRYSFKISNVGNTTVTDVHPIEQSFTGTGTLGRIVPTSVSLRPGESQEFTANYTVTDADVERGRIKNTAVAGGVDPLGLAVLSEVSIADVPSDLPNTGAQITSALWLSILAILGGTIVVVRTQRLVRKS